MDRFTVTSQTGQPVVRTNSPREAARYQHVLRGQIIDHQATEETVTAELVMDR